MKKITLAALALVLCAKLSAQADLGINSLMSPPLVSNGSSGILASDVSNAGITDITAGCATVTISVPSGISQITGINPGTNPVWVATNSPLTFPRTSITFRNIGGPILADLSNFSIMLDVKGISLGGPSNISTAVALTAAIVQGGCTGLGNLNTGNDNSTTSITVTVVTPVKLSSFNASVSDCRASLKWTSEQEENSKEYQVEASNDGRIFNTIGTVAAAGNSSIPKHYSFTDAAPAYGYNFYRLKFVSIGGEITYSSVITVQSKCDGKTVRLHPNPVAENNNLSVMIAGYKGSIRGELVTATGKVVGTFALKNGTNTVAIENVTQGAYMLRVTDGTNGRTESYKIVVTK